MTHELTLAEQAVEIREEFAEEATVYIETRSKVVLNHINALLDAYNIIRVELAYADGMGIE